MPTQHTHTLTQLANLFFLSLCLSLSLSLSLTNTLQRVKPFGGLVQVDGATGEHQYYLDPVGADIAHFAGATYADNGKVYLGSLYNEFLAVFTPEKM